MTPAAMKVGESFRLSASLYGEDGGVVQGEVRADGEDALLSAIDALAQQLIAGQALGKLRVLMGVGDEG